MRLAFTRLDFTLARWPGIYLLLRSMQNLVTSNSPPRAPSIKYSAPLGPGYLLGQGKLKEKAAAGGAAAFDFPTDPKMIGPWILGECVGKGASGRVKITKHRRTGHR